MGDYFAPNNCHDHVALLKQPGDRANICSGVLVSPDWILTDAHCVDFRRMSSAMRRPVVHLGGIRMRGSFEEVCIFSSGWCNLTVPTIGNGSL